MIRALALVLTTLALTAGCAAETDTEEPVHVRTADDFDDSEVTPQLRCRSGRPPQHFTCCDASDGCGRKYGCSVCL